MTVRIQCFGQLLIIKASSQTKQGNKNCQHKITMLRYRGLDMKGAAAEILTVSAPVLTDSILPS